jgi:ABC-type nitrate/sulfonate/bicarbonate transport system ATPase subunit
LNPVLSFTNVSKNFGTLEILKNLSFDIYERDTVGIIGPSGSGKTTILKLISGILVPDKGDIHISPGRVGYVFQDIRLLPWKTALENVAIPLSVVKNDYRTAIAESREWLERLGLKDFMDYYPSRLSGGMLQRVSLARAFAIEPEILIMDEPFGGLDNDLKKTLTDTVMDLLESYPVTMIYVSHVLEEVRRIVNKVVIYENGLDFHMLEETEFCKWKENIPQN